MEKQYFSESSTILLLNRDNAIKVKLKRQLFNNKIRDRIGSEIPISLREKLEG